MKILGIHEGHTCGACLLVDGKIIAMASEERLTRKKSSWGIPVKTIEWIFTIVDPKEIDAVALVGIGNPFGGVQQDDDRFIRRLFACICKVTPTALVASQFFVDLYLMIAKAVRKTVEVKQLLAGYGIGEDKIEIVDHHLAHAATAHYFSGQNNSDSKQLVLTMDGLGDGLCATVSIGQRNTLKLLARTSGYHSIGEFYMRTTQYLGMKPLEHEYKVMGLAPYAPPELVRESYRIFKSFFGLSKDSLEVRNFTGVWGMSLISLFRKKLAGLRFDAIAGGLQHAYEETLLGWVKSWLKKTEIPNLALAGGCFMNVKLNMLIAQLPEVKSLFIFPSPGDESLPMGGAVDVYLRKCKQNGITPTIEPVKEVYWGPSYTNDKIKDILSKYQNAVEWQKLENLEKKTAELLSSGKIIGRLNGKMEFGARALGNRSIISDARNFQNINKLNRAIKMRDFWMPFAPAILHERRKDYLMDSHEIVSPYMMIAFNTTQQAQIDLSAAIHQTDFTARPQLVEDDGASAFYRLLKEYEKITNCGGFLNTSFNLHGEPIVCSPTDAIDTFLRSELDYITLEDYLVWKKV